MKQKNILVLTYWSYDEALIQTYTLPYLYIIMEHLPAGSNISLLTLEKKKMKDEHKDEIRRELLKKNIKWIPYQYHQFGLVAALQWMRILYSLIWYTMTNNIQYLHAWCTPAGAIGYILSLLTNTKLIIDSYEPHAESMVENGTWRKGSAAFKVLFWLERRQTIRASHIIATTNGMADYAEKKYGVKLAGYFVKPACVDLSLFSLSKKKDARCMQTLGIDNNIVCVYAGKFGGIYLDQEVFDFLAVAYKYWGKSFRALLLTNTSFEEIAHYCKQAELDPSILIVRFVPHHEIPYYLGIGDFAITPVKPVPSKRFCTPIKDGEYWALGLPVVIPSNISDDFQIIEDLKIGAVLKTLDNDAYKSAVQVIDQLINTPGTSTRIRAVANKYRNFEIASEIYKKIYSKSNSDLI